MIAPIYVQPKHRANPRRVSPQRSAQEATKRRKAAQLKRRYRDCVRIGLISAAIVLGVVGYLALITRSTSLDDRLMTAQAQRQQLQEELVSLEDRRAQLEARDRLSQIATRLGFKEHPMMLVVDMPALEPQSTNTQPIIGAVESWLHLK